MLPPPYEGATGIHLVVPMPPAPKRPAQTARDAVMPMATAMRTRLMKDDLSRHLRAEDGGSNGLILCLIWAQSSLGFSCNLTSAALQAPICGAYGLRPGRAPGARADHCMGPLCPHRVGQGSRTLPRPLQLLRRGTGTISSLRGVRGLVSTRAGLRSSTPSGGGDRSPDHGEGTAVGRAICDEWQ